MAMSVNTAVLPVIEFLDKADCDHHLVSHLLSAVFVRNEGEREKSPSEPDFATTDHPVKQTHILTKDTSIRPKCCIKNSDRSAFPNALTNYLHKTMRTSGFS